MRNISKTLISLAFLTFACGVVPVYGEPAHPKPATVTMPDGSKLTVHLYGDEYGHYTATSDGYEVVRKPDGFFYYATVVNNQAVATTVVAKDASARGAADHAILSKVSRPGANNSQRLNALRMEKMAEMEKMAQPGLQRSASAVNTRAGEKFKSLVILVDFADLSFTTPSPNTAVYNLLNKVGYSENGAIGSAYDYYYENSNGRFDPQFDVKGPYKLSRNMAYYGGNDDRYAYQMAMDACQLAAADGVNFSDYIGSDGRVKDIYIFYAGFAESYSGNDSDTVWPHRGPDYLQYYGLSIQGLTFSGYACSSEFWGWQAYPNDQGFTGIGTFCHEYGHVLGWPDFYDTNYTTNGQSVHLEEYSLMSGGNHNTNGKKPPALRAIERKLMGWLDNETILSDSGGYELSEIYTSDKAYVVETSTPGEYYLMETLSSRRNKWDAGLYDEFKTHIEGMLVTHIDKSNVSISGIGSTAQQLWNSNRLNAYSSHPCVRIVKAVNVQPAYLYRWIFPQSGVTVLSESSHSEFVPWRGSRHDTFLRNISYSNGKVTFSVGPDILAESIDISEASLSLGVGQQHTLTATVLPTNASIRTVVWSSSNDNVATVNNGEVTAIGQGQANITARLSDGSLSAVCRVNVIDEISGVNLVSAYQNDAELSWPNSTHAGNFRVELYKAGELVKQWTTSEKYAYVSLLSSGAGYSLKVTVVNGDQSTGTTVTKDFSTPSVGYLAQQSIYVQGSYSASKEVPLRVLNTEGTPKSVKWTVDGKSAEAPAVKLSAGRHKLEVTVTGEDGSVEKITKFITVK